MHITLPAPNLADAATKTASFTGKGFISPVWIHAENGLVTLHGNNASIDFYAERAAAVQRPGTAGVNAQNFAALLQSLGAGDVSLRMDDDLPVLHITHGRRKLKLPTVQPAWAPQRRTPPEPDGPETVWTGAEFANIVKMVSYCAESRDTGGYEHCVHFKRNAAGMLEIAAMDGKRCAVLEYPAPEAASLAATPFNIATDHLRALFQWMPKTDIALFRSEKRLMVRAMDDGEYCILPLNLMQYPDYSRFMDRKNTPECAFTADTGELSAALGRIDVLVTDHTSQGADLHISGAELTLGFDRDSGGIHDCITLASPAAGKESTMTLNVKHMRAALAHFTSKEVTMTYTGTGPGKPVFLHADVIPGYTAVTMPMVLHPVQQQETAQ